MPVSTTSRSILDSTAAEERSTYCTFLTRNPSLRESKNHGKPGPWLSTWPQDDTSSTGEPHPSLGHGTSQRVMNDTFGKACRGTAPTLTAIATANNEELDEREREVERGSERKRAKGCCRIGNEAHHPSTSIPLKKIVTVLYTVVHTRRNRRPQCIAPSYIEVKIHRCKGRPAPAGTLRGYSPSATNPWPGGSRLPLRSLLRGKATG